MSKNILVIGLLVLASVSASAFAADRADSIPVEGAKALALQNALTAAGAQMRTVPDAGFLNVSNVDCTAGYSIMTHGPYANCTLEQQIPGPRGTHFIRLVKLTANGEKARALVNALEDAGLRGQNYVEMTRFEAGAVNCSVSYFIGRPGRQCTIEASNNE